MHSEEWTEVEVVERYLSRADAFPHRLEGEQVLLDHLPAGARRVLDLGAGDGRLLAMVLRERPEATGVALDFSDVMLAAARERFAGDDRVEIVQHNLRRPAAVARPLRRGRLLDGHPPPRGRAQARGLRRGVRAVVARSGVFANFEHVKSPTERMHYAFLAAIGEPEEHDDPSDQLLDAWTQVRWLGEIGFEEADVYWKYLEMALLLGVKP